MSKAFGMASVLFLGFTIVRKSPMSYPMRSDSKGTSYRRLDFLLTSIVTVLLNCRNRSVTG